MGKTPKKKAPKGDGQQRDGDWQCSCGFWNWARRDKCRDCGRAKPTASANKVREGASNWKRSPGATCTQCGLKGHTADQCQQPKCSKCGKHHSAKRTCAEAAKLISAAQSTGPASAKMAAAHEQEMESLQGGNDALRQKIAAHANSASAVSEKASDVDSDSKSPAGAAQARSMRQSEAQRAQ